MPSPLQGTIERKCTSTQWLVHNTCTPLRAHYSTYESKQDLIVRMDFDFKGSRPCKLFAFESEVVIEKHEEVDKCCFSSSHVECNSPIHETFDAIWVLLASHRELDATIGLELLDRVDAISQAVCFQELFQAPSNVHRNRGPGVVIHL